MNTKILFLLNRAGCAILYILQDSGHNILVTNGEERGRMGSKFLMRENADIADEINNSSFVVQLDRRNGNDYKCYNLPVTEEFKNFISKETGYIDAGTTSFTDIVDLCTRICGVNLSVGYVNEHKPNESLVICDWINTLNVVTNLLKKPLKKYSLKLT